MVMDPVISMVMVVVMVFAFWFTYHGVYTNVMFTVTGYQLLLWLHGEWCVYNDLKNIFNFFKVNDQFHQHKLQKSQAHKD